MWIPRGTLSITGHNESRHEPNDAPNGAEGDNRDGDSGRRVWRRKGATIPTPQGSVPSAQVGEQTSSTPATRLTDSTKILSFTNTHPQTPTFTMETPTGEDANQTTDQRRVVIKVPEALLASMRNQCDKKASVSLLGRIQGKHPGFKALTAWARENLHSSFEFLSIQANNVFEVTFSQPEGRIHALNQTDLMCENVAIFFSSWCPHFDPSLPHATERLDYPVWMQVVNLCQVQRNDAFLHTIGGQIGQVISIDNTEAYRAKLFGPRIRLLVRDLDSLPHTVALPRLDGEGTLDYAVEFSGLPNQCGRCRSREHQVRYCPKRELTSRHRNPQRPNQQRREHPNRSTHTSPTRIPDPSSPTPALDAPIANQEEEQDLQPPTQVVSDPATKNQQTDNSDEPTAREEPQQDTTIALKTLEPAEAIDSTVPSYQPDELNFPKLPTSTRMTASKETIQEQNQNSPEHTSPAQFVWRSKPIIRDMDGAVTPEPELRRDEGSKGKGKQVNKPPDSAPLTRQGYRSGRLAEDFWAVLNIPNTPLSQRKTLRVIPILIRDRPDETRDYLVNTKQAASRSIALVHIAEQLAGIPWIESRARQHIVSEVAQALYKVLVFTNPSANPLQKWKQGKWFANWEGDPEGVYTCTLYVTVLAQENKIKPRKGHAHSWIRLPGDISNRVQLHSSNDIEAIEEDCLSWYKLTHN